jgi:hypothetical protein
MADPNVFSRALKDANVQPADFALPAAASSSTNSTAVNLNDDAHKADLTELELSVPALNTTIVPNASTVNYIIETSTVSNFASIDQTLMNEVQTGAGGVGVAAFKKRVRIPSNCAQYVRAKVTLGASTTTAAAISGTFSPLF